MSVAFPEDDDRVVSHIYQNKSSQRAPQKTDFVFNRVFQPSASQKDIYDCAVRQIVDQFIDGYNCTIFAYG